MNSNEEMLSGYGNPDAGYPDATLFGYRLC